MKKNNDHQDQKTAIIEIPTKNHSRFVFLPSDPGVQQIMLLENVIRFNLPRIFSHLGYTHFEASMFKVTKDAEIDIDNDISTTFIQKIEKGLKNRRKAQAIRFLYEKKMNEGLLELLIRKLNLSHRDSIIPGGNIRNFRDFMEFPATLSNSETRPRPFLHPALSKSLRVCDVIMQQDILLHTPYHSFNSIIDLLREAAMDPDVKSIKITAYRLAAHSKICNALINAVRNGKQVHIFLELRASFDVFENGKISPLKAQKLIETMQVFQDLLTFYDVKHLKACATSAMRDALNSHEMIQAVESRTGIKIRVISGDEEAILMNETHIAENMDREHSYLYVNVGGGSTDVIFFADGKVHYKKSFDIGSIRILKNQVAEPQWNQMKSQLKKYVKKSLPLVAIGSGGNINRIFSLSKKEGKPLKLELLKKYYADLSSISVKERMRLYKLREDRADVIVPALEIYINLMRWSGINEIYVPKICLVDGLAQSLYQEIVSAL